MDGGEHAGDLEMESGKEAASGHMLAVTGPHPQSSHQTSSSTHLPDGMGGYIGTDAQKPDQSPAQQQLRKQRVYKNPSGRLLLLEIVTKLSKG
ncbi:hypothetical protein MHYP_G00317960 [Metynnis hypsauchen]